jgi:phage N-6-adenine-methyltransferase
MSKESDLYETPPEVFSWAEASFGPFNMDVCAEKATAKAAEYFGLDKNQDSLTTNWSLYGRSAWMNPPYSDIGPWLAKAREQAAKGVRTTCLLPADSSTAWWQENIEDQPFVYVRRIPKRIRFIFKGQRAGSPNFASVIVVFFPRLPYPGTEK